MEMTEAQTAQVASLELFTLTAWWASHGRTWPEALRAAMVQLGVEHVCVYLSDAVVCYGE